MVAILFRETDSTLIPTEAFTQHPGIVTLTWPNIWVKILVKGEQWTGQEMTYQVLVGSPL